jgi:hypothetical protein
MALGPRVSEIPPKKTYDAARISETRSGCGITRYNRLRASLYCVLVLLRLFGWKPMGAKPQKYYRSDRKKATAAAVAICRIPFILPGAIEAPGRIALFPPAPA